MLVWLLTILAGTALILIGSLGLAIWEGKPLDLGASPDDVGLILMLISGFAAAFSLPAMILLAFVGLAVDRNDIDRTWKYGIIQGAFLLFLLLTEMVLAWWFTNGRDLWEEPLPLLMVPYAVAGLVLLHIMLRRRLWSKMI